MAKSFDEINEKIKQGTAVVLTADEVADLAKTKSIEQLADEVDVVTTATFSPMCSSGVFLNFGHADPPIKMAQLELNGVPASGGLAAVDTYVGAAEPSVDRGINYGGAHVIEDLLRGKEVTLKAKGFTTDCYPRKEVTAKVSLDNMNQAYMFNPRNAYQNYAAATNSTDKKKFTYMGCVLPSFGNVMYATSGQLSPLLKDPELRTIGVGTRIFLGGAIGYVAWEGTQSVRSHETFEDGAEMYSGQTLALIGDLKQMSPEFIRAAVMENYGTTIFIGMGIPIPVLDADLMAQLAKRDDELYTHIYDYGLGLLKKPQLKRVSYAELRSGSVEVNGKMVKTASLSSISKARAIADRIKTLVKSGEFMLTQPVAPLPKDNTFKPMTMIGEDR
ncbi:MAG: homocysteine biosynthesis protein [Eubacteriales bacterium]